MGYVSLCSLSLLFQCFGLCRFLLGFHLLKKLISLVVRLSGKQPFNELLQHWIAGRILPFCDTNFSHLFDWLLPSLQQKAVVMCTIKYGSLSGFLGRLWKNFLPKFLLWNVSLLLSKCYVIFLSLLCLHLVFLHFFALWLLLSLLKITEYDQKKKKRRGFFSCSFQYVFAHTQSCWVLFNLQANLKEAAEMKSTKKAPGGSEMKSSHTQLVSNECIVPELLPSHLNLLLAVKKGTLCTICFKPSKIHTFTALLSKLVLW